MSLYAKQQPKAGDFIFHCGHLGKIMEWSTVPAGISFFGAGGVKHFGKWLAECPKCFAERRRKGGPPQRPRRMARRQPDYQGNTQRELIMMRWFGWIGLMVALGGIAWGCCIAWSRPELTERELWLMYPLELGGSLAMVFGGMLLAAAGKK